jgi:hypothetical protein
MGVIIVEDFDDDSSPTSDVGIMVDINKIVTVFRNFISNALKFSKRDQRIVISTRLQQEFSQSFKQLNSEFNYYRKETALDKNGSFITNEVKVGVIRISVIDEGVGISESNIKKLFQQYVQINPNELQGGKGSGIGLWLSKSIVDSLEGMIGVSSVGEGHGCTFYVEFPYYLSKSSSINSYSSQQNLSQGAVMSTAMTSNFTTCMFDPNIATSRETSISPIDVLCSDSTCESSGVDDLSDSCLSMPHFARNYETEKYNILVVDDAILVRKMVVRALKEVTNICSIASSGYEALQRVADDIGFYDVILVDCYMPEASHYSFITRY